MARNTAYFRRIAADMLREELEMDGTEPSALADIFEREPVPLQSFLTDTLKNPMLGPIQYDFVRHLEQIFLPETYIAMVEEFGDYWVPERSIHFLVAQWGKGGGKDHCCRMGVTRVADLLMCLKSPQAYYGIPPQDDIHILNVASSADQARRAFFAPMKALFVSNDHLSDFFRSGEPPGEMATSIRLKRGIELVSGHSMADTQEGLNILVGIADEISAFKTKDELARAGIVADGRESRTAESILKMMRTSARSRFPQSFKIAQISFPRFKGDAIQQATTAGLASIEKYGDQSPYFVSGPHATWDVNPRVSDRSQFQEDYDDDPEMAASMYECKPAPAVNRFMRNDTAIAQAFSRVVPDPVTVEYYWGLPETPMLENVNAPDEVEGWQVRFSFHPDFSPMTGALYALHGDLALTGDRAGIAMSHVRTWMDSQPNIENAVFETRPVVRNDFVFSFESDLKATSPDGEPAPREIQIRWYRQLIWRLIADGFDVDWVSFDGFQSADMIQVLMSRGISAKRLSLDRNDTVYQDFKSTVEDNRLESYFRPRVIEEVRALRRLPNRKIDHPSNSSKDEADALAGSVFGALDIGGDEGELPTPVNYSDTFVFGAAVGETPPFDLSFGDTSLDVSELDSLTFG